MIFQAKMLYYCIPDKISYVPCFMQGFQCDWVVYSDIYIFYIHSLFQDHILRIVQRTNRGVSVDGLQSTKTPVYRYVCKLGMYNVHESMISDYVWNNKDTFSNNITDKINVERNDTQDLLLDYPLQKVDQSFYTVHVITLYNIS